MNDTLHGTPSGSNMNIDNSFVNDSSENGLVVLEVNDAPLSSCGCSGGGCCGKKKNPKTRPVTEYLSRAEGAVTPNFVEVEFKGQRREVFLNKHKLSLSLYDIVVVETHQGIHAGTVAAFGYMNEKILKKVETPAETAYSVVRLATEEEVLQNESNIAEEQAIIHYARTTSQEYGQEMKVTDAEWQLDRKQLTIYFTAPQRIDFRELVKNFARVYKTRIELRQISGRDEATRIGGIGTCGMALCCTSFKPEVAHITLDHARTQQLSTSNISKLTGMCGRLKCCLMYEIDNYVSVQV